MSTRTHIDPRDTWSDGSPAAYRKAFQVLEHCDPATTVESFADRALEGLGHTFGVRYVAFFSGNSLAEANSDTHARLFGDLTGRHMMDEYVNHWHSSDPFATEGPQAQLQTSGVASLCEKYVLPPAAADYVTSFLQERGIGSGTALTLPLPKGKVALIGLFDQDPMAITLMDLPVLRRMRRQLAVISRGLASPDSYRWLDGLTPRQQDVAVLVAKGLTNAAIAQRLFLREDTIKKYVSRLLTSAGCATRTELAMIMQRHTRA